MSAMTRFRTMARCAVQDPLMHDVNDERVRRPTLGTANGERLHATVSTAYRLSKAIMILLATVFGCIGVLTASSLAYNAALDLSAPHTLSPATYADPLRNASAYAVKSRKPRALVPWKKKVPGMQVPVVTDEYTRKLKMDGITERMGINLRPVRDDGAFPDGLPHWFSEFLFRKGEDLGPRGHTRLVATENCDMIVVRKYQDRLSEESQQRIPSVYLKTYKSPLFSTPYGFVTDANGVGYEAEPYYGMSLYDLIEMGVVGKEMDAETTWWFINVVDQVLRYQDHVSPLELPQKGFDTKSVLLVLKNPPTSDGRPRLSIGDRVVMGRMHCATISDVDELKNIECITEDGYYDPALLQGAQTAPLPFYLVAKSFVGQMMMDVLGLAFDVKGKLLMQNIPRALFSYKVDLHRLVAHLYFNDLRDHCPSPAGTRFFGLFKAMREYEGRPNAFYCQNVVLNPAFAERVEWLEVLIRFYDNGQLRAETRRFYPSLDPFATVECHLRAGDRRTLCQVGDLKQKIESTVPAGVPAPGGDSPGVFCQGAGDYAYPRDWDQGKCEYMLDRTPRDIVTSLGILPLRINWCKLPKFEDPGRWTILLDKGPPKLADKVYKIKCCGYVSARKDTKCDADPGKPSPFTPWNEDLFFAVNDLLVPFGDPANPRYDETAPLIERCDPAKQDQPNRWDDLYPPALRTHLANQRTCLAKSTKTTDIAEPRSIPKNVFLPQQYMVPTSTNKRKHLWILANVRWSTFKLPGGNRMDACVSDADFGEQRAFCVERGYECVVLDEDFTIRTFVELLARYTPSFGFESLTLTLTTLGQRDEHTRKDYVYFPNGERAKRVVIDELLDEFLLSKQFVGRLKYVQIGTCQSASVMGPAFQAVVEPIDYVVTPTLFPQGERNVPKTYTLLLHDTARSRRFIVKAFSHRGSNFLHQYFKAAREHPEMTLTELWHLVQARLTFLGPADKESVEITTDTLGHPGNTLPLPVS